MILGKKLITNIQKSHENTRKLGLGSVQFGVDYGISNTQGRTTDDEVRKILNLASKYQIDTIDTARLYGKSEEVLGTMNLHGFKIISKYPFVIDAITFTQQLQLSLHYLQINNIYGYIAHRPLSIVENPEIWDALLRAKEDGVISKIGFSFNTVSEAEIVLRYGFIPDLVQAPFNYFDQRFQNIMQELKDDGCEIHSRSSFLQGLLFMKPSELNVFFKPVFSLLENLQEHSISLPGMLLHFCIKQKFIDKVIIGVNNAAQLQANLLTLDDDIPDLSLPDINIPDSILTPSEWPTTK